MNSAAPKFSFIRFLQVAVLLNLLSIAGNSYLSAQPPTSICSTRLPSLPLPTSNNAVASVDNQDGTFTLLSFMGLQATNIRGVTDATYRLDWPGGDWVQVADAPRRNNRAKIGANAISVANQVFLQGGYTISRTAEFTEERFFRYDLNDDEFVELAAPPVPVDDTVTGVYQDRYIYVMSGWNGPSRDNTLTVQFYDTQTDTWALATEMPGPHTGLFGHSGTIVGDKIIVFDGTKTDDGFNISDSVFVGQIDPLGVGDLTQIEWSSLDAHPGSPTYRAAVSPGAAIDNRMLLLGGTDNPYNFNGTGYDNRPSNPLEQALLFDPSTEEWSTIEIEGDVLATMDHRGLVRVPNGFATIGGMSGPGDITGEVIHYSFDNVACVPEPPAEMIWMMLTMPINVLIRSRNRK